MSKKFNSIKEIIKGFEIWKLNGKVHREDGPALIYPDGTQFWFINNNIHREDGPAIILPNGKKEWYYKGKQVSEEELKQINIEKLYEDLDSTMNTNNIKKIVKIKI
jgi:hypothetical protein